LLGGSVLTYKSNKPYYITIKAASANFSGGVAESPIAAGVIKYKLNPSGTYASLTSNPSALVGSAAAMQPNGKGTYSIDFFIDPDYISAPAQNYVLQVIYTISNL
jgi:hypothetical protein